VGQVWGTTAQTGWRNDEVDITSPPRPSFGPARRWIGECTGGAPSAVARLVGGAVVGPDAILGPQSLPHSSEFAPGVQTVTVSPTSAAPGSLVLRPAPAGLPEAEPRPPTIASTGDPFTTVRILQLVARIERGRPARVADLVAALNARHLDWAFSPMVVTDTLVQLQSNWMADYRNGSGIVIEDGPHGPTISLEDSSRVDPWIVRQVEREIGACQAALTDFSRRDGSGFDD
ncbi:MAG: hypothetical protein QOF11_1290, partial [Chloroflexota bacterium]|nr:hypothetical protein [Chloroflexota bacterium]